MSQAGVNRAELQQELPSAQSHDAIECVGPRLWIALHSTSWKLREAAASAFLSYLEAGLTERYQRSTKELFNACISVSTLLFDDKVQSNYMIGLKVLDQAITPPIFNPKEIKPKVFQKEMAPFTQILLNKSLDLNQRGREVAQKSLIALYDNPALDTVQLVDGLMDFIGKNGMTPENAPERLVLGRLELLI